MHVHLETAKVKQSHAYSKVPTFRHVDEQTQWYWNSNVKSSECMLAWMSTCAKHAWYSPHGVAQTVHEMYCSNGFRMMYGI